MVSAAGGHGSQAVFLFGIGSWAPHWILLKTNVLGESEVLCGFLTVWDLAHLILHCSRVNRTDHEVMRGSWIWKCPAGSGRSAVDDKVESAIW